jgi:predicted adenylyl cyclase CyaB
MPQNVEIKARIASREEIAAKVALMANGPVVELFQDDTFFTCDSGRLKLRRFSDNEGELIFYQRSDQKGPKTSFYLRSQTTDPKGLHDVLVRAYGETARVRKSRLFYLIGRTRVHLDRVEVLGDFLELEVVLEENEPPQNGVIEAHRLMENLGIEPSQLLEGAYADLLKSV